jgi:hypothetical protein
MTKKTTARSTEELGEAAIVPRLRDDQKSQLILNQWVVLLLSYEHLSRLSGLECTLKQLITSPSEDGTIDGPFGA